MLTTNHTVRYAGTLLDGSADVDYLCLEDGQHKLVILDDNPEVSWELEDISGSSFSGRAPIADIFHTDGGTIFGAPSPAPSISVFPTMIPTLMPTPTTATPTAISSSTPTDSPTSEPTPSNLDDGDDNNEHDESSTKGLSPGALAGGAVAIAIAGLGLGYAVGETRVRSVKADYEGRGRKQRYVNA